MEKNASAFLRPLFSLKFSHLSEIFFFNLSFLFPKFRGKNPIFSNPMMFEKGVYYNPVHSRRFLISSWFVQSLSFLVPSDLLRLPSRCNKFRCGSVWCHKFRYKFDCYCLLMSSLETCLPYLPPVLCQFFYYYYYFILFIFSISLKFN